MSDGWTIYWITRMDILQTAFMLIASAVGLVTVSILTGNSLNRGYDGSMTGMIEASDRWSLRRGLPITAIFGLLAVLIPTTKQAAAILAIPAIANSEDAQEIAGEVVDLAKQWLEELKPEVEDE